MFLFGRKKAPETKSEKKKAVAFIDYEHWYISLTKQFSLKPDIKAWRDELAEKYDIVEMAFFGDFSNASLRGEISKIREVSNYIIETQNATSFYKKDFTDFIMLDHIYQRAIASNDIDTFIIFTGDGHFSSVVSFLTTKCHKTVGIYGIRDAISSSLKNSATYFECLPNEKSIMEVKQKRYYMMIMRALTDIYNTKRFPHPTFLATIDAVARDNKCDKAEITAAMQELIENGSIYQMKKYSHRTGKTVKILAINKEIAAQNHLLE